MALSDVGALAAFVAVGAGSPGPNNTLLLASGMSFGFRRTLPHVAGTTVGISLLIGLAAVGAGAVVTAVPGVQVALKLVASAYLLFLAVRLARGLSLGGGTVAEPFTVPRAVLFQFINPKGWFFALALVGAFTQVGRPATEGAILWAVASTIVTATAVVWALGGSALSRALAGERSRRVAGWILGVVLAGSVVFLWI